MMIMKKIIRFLSTLYIFYSIELSYSLILFHLIAQITPSCHNNWYFTMYGTMNKLLAYVISDV